MIRSVVVLLVLFCVQACASSPDNSRVSGTRNSGYNVQGATKINVATAKELFDRQVVFIDVRENVYVKSGYIQGAKHLSLMEGDFTQESLAAIAAKTDEIVIYCDGATCDHSPKACSKALTWGYENVYYFAEGFPGWESAGLPIDQ